MDMSDLKLYVDTAKTLLDLFKSARQSLPDTPQRKEIDEKIKAAEDIMKRSDAKLARALGYSLCQCTFPPQIMLWKEATKSRDCPSCGRQISGIAKFADQEDEWLNVRRQRFLFTVRPSSTSRRMALMPSTSRKFRP
jgi:hypothetical protein